MTQNLTTVAEWAKLVGISRQSAYDAVTRCGIPLVDGKLDPDYATHLYQKHTRPRANAQRPSPMANEAPASTPAGAGGAETEAKPAKVPGYDTSRARREAAEATAAEIKLAEMSGQFLLKADVDAAAFEAARALRDGLMNCARRIAADVAPLRTAEECEDVIEREMRALLESMAHAFSERLDVQLKDLAG